jgi:hypothetical protein
MKRMIIQMLSEPFCSILPALLSVRLFKELCAGGGNQHIFLIIFPKYIFLFKKTDINKMFFAKKIV